MLYRLVFSNRDGMRHIAGTYEGVPPLVIATPEGPVYKLKSRGKLAAFYTQIMTPQEHQAKEHTSMIKMGIIFRRDLKMSTGKMVAQGCHAACAVLEDASPMELEQWQKNGQTKIVLQVADEQALKDIEYLAKFRGLNYYLVRDAGKTEVAAGSVTCLAVGPGKIDSVIGDLALWKE